MSPHADYDPTAPDLAEVEQLRARTSEAERLAALRNASLEEITVYAEKLRIYVADFTDDSYTQFSAKSYPPEGLRYVTERVNRLAELLARAAAGYAHAHSKDMDCPRIADDLAAHGWISRPDRTLDGTLPPLPLDKLRDARGYRRGFARGAETLTLWFTCPDSLAYAKSSARGALRTAAEVRAVISG
ncbi:hypothetical protein [Amycolatopsis circi]|uniref:hypothetical protein n=1 Tax=Amycolatopsis circi TaxID=871959 RepID=UPI000E2350A5|nr:hypothetical protein [Amycolatopsis circi]